MKIALYTRVSTEGKSGAPGQTVDPQLLELRSYCSRQDWPVVAEYTDVISGTRAQRPGLDALVMAVEKGEVDVVLVVKMDRLGRSLLNVLRLIERLEQAGCAIICTSQGIDTRKDSPCGKMMLGLIAVFSQFERSLIVERTRAGLAVARKNGKVLGKPSAALVGVDIPAVVSLWREETGGIGLRELAVRLGGVSVSTAQRLARDHTAQA